jgi:hypothetical protein
LFGRGGKQVITITRPIPLYAFLVAAALLALPLAAAQLSPSRPAADWQARGCVSALAKAERLIDEIANPSRTDLAERQLEIARNMLDQQDEPGCMAYIDNAVRAIK